LASDADADDACQKAAASAAGGGGKCAGGEEATICDRGQAEEEKEEILNFLRSGRKTAKLPAICTKFHEPCFVTFHFVEFSSG
jgi:hypothetical protein